MLIVAKQPTTAFCSRVGTNRLLPARARHTATKSLSRPADPAVSAIEPRKSHWDPEGRPHATRGSRESHPSRQPFLSSRWSRFAAGVHQTVDVGPRGHAPSRFPKEATRPPGRPAGQAQFQPGRPLKIARLSSAPEEYRTAWCTSDA